MIYYKQRRDCASIRRNLATLMCLRRMGKQVMISKDHPLMEKNLMYHKQVNSVDQVQKNLMYHKQVNSDQVQENLMYHKLSCQLLTWSRNHHLRLLPEHLSWDL